MLHLFRSSIFYDWIQLESGEVFVLLLLHIHVFYLLLNVWNDGGCPTPGHQIAAIVMSFFMSFWNLFSGFLIARPLLPIWWRWYYWGSPIAWTIYGVITSQFGDLKTTFIETPTQGPQRLDLFIQQTWGYDHDFLIPVVFAHVGWVLLFFFVFAYGIKYLNFQRR
ncbi:hypothetical protein M0R45_009186 [Rubus argutus]|uniref:ABC-2 type transporter transmembrane domain-containing protein n=1 Tax=Rubus argutus TaxID=59490 RepID=A0AAW1Y3T2_RUBAR